MRAENGVVISFQGGSASGSDVETALQQAWTKLTDASRRAEIAARLDMPEEIVASMRIPFVVRSVRSNFDPASIAITVLIWAGSDIILGAATEIARDEVKRRLKLVWPLVEREVRRVFDTRNALGKAVKLDGTENG